MSSARPTPSTPRVISPSPAPSDTESGRDGYFGPTTRSATRSQQRRSPTIPEQRGNESPGSDYDPDQRARTRSRSPIFEGSQTRRRLSGLTSIKPRSGIPSASGKPVRQAINIEQANGSTNGHLSPHSASNGKWNWRELSRSPSPLGLIPIHTQWRTFIHKHEVPRKVLHVSIGFITLYLYAIGVQTSQIHPVLLSALIPITAVDVLRHNSAPFNRAYIKLVGALMRETEVDGWNGVIWYLLGAWAVLRFCPKDVGVMGVLLLSWCDTAASTFGRLYGRYTPLIRKGKSLAGSVAAMLVGIMTAVLFYGVLAPWGTQKGFNFGEHALAYQGQLSLPADLVRQLGLSKAATRVTGGLALSFISIVAGFIGAASEAVDLFGWDDNLTIPVISAAGLWAFLAVFT